MKAMSLVLVLSLVIGGCKSGSKSKDQSGGDGVTWQGRMQNLSASLGKLLPLAHDPIQFNDPANQAVIQQEVSRLADFSHDLGRVKQKVGDDPALDFVANRFSQDMQEAKRQLQVGNTGYSRFLIRNATNYCISCHTQTDRGPQFDLGLEGPFYKKLNPIDRAHYLIAVRSFDRAMTEFESAMSSPDLALQSFASLESLTLKGLAVAVRVKKDPALADRILTRMIESKWAPVYLQMSGIKWRESVQEWRKSGKRPVTLAEAKRLISIAWKKQMESPLSRAGLIESLRASAILHERLDSKKAGKEYAETLYYAGLASESLKELDLYNASEHYYESCIRHLPHSEMAKNCYVRLERVSIANYGQLDNTPLPYSVRENLDKLKKLAETSGKSWADWATKH